MVKKERPPVFTIGEALEDLTDESRERWIKEIRPFIEKHAKTSVRGIVEANKIHPLENSTIERMCFDLYTQMQTWDGFENVLGPTLLSIFIDGIITGQAMMGKRDWE